MLQRPDDGQMTSPLAPYVDKMESELKNNFVPKPMLCPTSELSASQFVVYRYGLLIVQFLNRKLSQLPTKLLLAKAVPQQELKSKLQAPNAFQNSFYWDRRTRTIHLRVERTRDVGLYTVILAHIVSHIKCGEWADDHPKFVEMFYSCLRFLCAELFFSRVSKKHSSSITDTDSDGAGGLNGEAGDGLIAELREAFGAAKELAEKEEIIDNFLDLKIVDGSLHDHFSESRLSYRLHKYTQFSQNIRLQEHLQNLERAVRSTARKNLGLEDDLADEEEEFEKGALSEAQKREQQKKRLANSVAQLADESDNLNSRLLSVVNQIRQLSSKVVKLQDFNGQGERKVNIIFL